MVIPLTVYKNYIKACERVKIKPAKDILLVSIPEQALYRLQEGQLEEKLTISTSARPPSCIENSLGTPTGLHQIAEKHGEGVPLGGVLKGRVFTGKHFSEFSEEELKRNLITTRILWLDGLEEGHNRGGERDTKKRYVYLHGTNRENDLGTPMSHGCVLLTNDDIFRFYNLLPLGTHVWIDETGNTE